MLQYITDMTAPTGVAEQVRKVIEGGCRWIQISMRGASDEEISAVVEEIKPLCLEKEAFLLLDGNVELAKTLNVGGVNLRKTDMLPSKARMILGAGAVIGIEANTFDDVKAVRSLDVDYIALRPYRHSPEREDDSPELGLEGIRRLSTEMLENEINIAHVAAGGVRKEDVVELMEAGVNGVAVSRDIAYSADIAKTTADYLAQLAPFMPKG